MNYPPIKIVFNGSKKSSYRIPKEYFIVFDTEQDRYVLKYPIDQIVEVVLDELCSTFKHIDFKTIENVERIINGVVQKMIESNKFSNGAKSVVDRMNINWN